MLNSFNFKKFGDRILITNDLGRFCFLSDDEFKDFITENELKDVELNKKLKEDYFIYDGPRQIFVQNAGMELRNYKRYLFTGTSLHIFVLTNYCNQSCIYCQASVNKKYSMMMSKETARMAVDLAIQSPSKFLTFEFQGGEPLANFETLRFIVEYTKSINTDKIIQFAVVSNLLLLEDYMLDFLIENNVSISTSVDGNEKLHNINRPANGVNSFNSVREGIKKIKLRGYSVSAIQTTTRHSLNMWKELVDQYVELGIKSIFIRPLTQLGYAEKNWDTIGYKPEEFLDFYRNAIYYIISLAKTGIDISEGHAKIFLRKIIGHDSQNYMELRSPCGAGIGQLAYYYDGNIYTCDEGRMLAEMGDKSFCIGNVYSSDFKDIMSNPVCKSVAVASCLENIPSCTDCVYVPYCGTCPVINYAKYNTIFCKEPESFRCSIYKGILDILFEILLYGDGEAKQILYSWAE